MILYFPIFYLLCISIIGFLSMGIDKHKAKKGTYRISEKTLLLIAVFGGSIGSLLGMKFFHHKTLHKKFTIGIPAILVLQILCIFSLYYLYKIPIFSLFATAIKLFYHCALHL